MPAFILTYTESTPNWSRRRWHYVHPLGAKVRIKVRVSWQTPCEYIYWYLSAWHPFPLLSSPLFFLHSPWDSREAPNHITPPLWLLGHKLGPSVYFSPKFKWKAPEALWKRPGRRPRSFPVSCPSQSHDLQFFPQFWNCSRIFVPINLPFFLSQSQILLC